MECFNPENQAALLRAVQKVKTISNINIGCPEMPGDHPVFSAVQKAMREQLGETPFMIRTRLASEQNKQYGLILSDIPESGGIS